MTPYEYQELVCNFHKRMGLIYVHMPDLRQKGRRACGVRSGLAKRRENKTAAEEVMTHNKSGTIHPRKSRAASQGRRERKYPTFPSEEFPLLASHLHPHPFAFPFVPFVPWPPPFSVSSSFSPSPPPPFPGPPSRRRRLFALDRTSPSSTSSNRNALSGSSRRRLWR